MQAIREQFVKNLALWSGPAANERALLALVPACLEHKNSPEIQNGQIEFLADFSAGVRVDGGGGGVPVGTAQLPFVDGGGHDQDGLGIVQLEPVEVDDVA